MLQNTGGANYTSVTGVLSPVTPGVSVSASNAVFGNMAAGQIRSNGLYDLDITIPVSAQTGADLQFLLRLRDSAGNTQNVAISIFCIPQLLAHAAAPQVSGAGSNVQISATLRGTSNQPDETGISHVIARMQSATGGGYYYTTLTNQPDSTGIFSSPWTVPAANDWLTTLYVVDVRGNTGTYAYGYTSGFSSKPFDTSADVLLFADLDYGEACANVSNAIVAAKRTCSVWPRYYRGSIPAAVLSNHAARTLFYYGGLVNSTLSSDSTLRSTLGDFIARGGRVCMSGGYIANMMNSGANRTWLSNAFGAVQGKLLIASAGTFTTLVAVAGDPLGAGLARFNLGKSSTYRSELLAVGRGTNCWMYDLASRTTSTLAFASNGIAAVRTENTTRTVFLPWDLGSPYLGTTERNRLTTNILAYLALPITAMNLLSATVLDAGGDGLLSPNEAFQLQVVLRNEEAAADQVQVSVSSGSALLTWSQTNWTVGALAMGQTVTNQAAVFAGNLVAGAPPGAWLPIQIRVQAQGGYNQVFESALPVAPPELFLHDYLINDSLGNSDCALDVGEKVFLLAAISNRGAAISGATASLVTTCPYLVLVNATSRWAAIAEGGVGWNLDEPFCLQVTAGAPGTFDAPVLLQITCQPGNRVAEFQFGIGQDYTLVSNALYHWVDTSAGAPLAVGDDSYQKVPLGFDFQLYDLRTNAVHVGANGLLMLGTPSTIYNNVAIPNAAIPNAMIAPRWDDLNSSLGGVIRWQAFGAAPRRLFVAEWSAVPDYNSSISTCQAILHENGAIQFQYGESSGTAADGRSATIGIENPTGSAGRQYAYNKIGAVFNGQAISFTRRIPAPDSNGNQLPDAYENCLFTGVEPVDGNADEDHDGVNNAHEWFAGTNPFDSNSVLYATARYSINGIVLAWPGFNGRPYSVWRGTNLSEQAQWLPLTPMALPGAALNCYTATVDTVENSQFLRISTP